MKLEAKCPRERLRSRWEQQVRKDVLQKEGRAWEGSEGGRGRRKIFEEMKVNRESWLVTRMKVETLKEDAGKKTVITHTY
jgi:hypothetical protein